jgi:DNA-binding response OmpR family regulator/HPt (histidine-containing phosphotransfer) domain-containing protein
MHIGILEDDLQQQEIYQLWLGNARHTCACFVSVKDFVAALQQDRFDLLLIDWMLPESSGEAALKWVRAHLGWEIPVIFVTARDQEADLVAALKEGADDYLVKPPRRMELLARIEALTRRLKAPLVLKFGVYEADPQNHSIIVRGEGVKLTQKEYELAAYLFQHPGKLLSRVHLLEQLWGLNAEVDTRTVDTHVSRLRKKLAIGPDNGWQIVPVHGWGYRMEKVGAGEMECPKAGAADSAPAAVVTPAGGLPPLPGIDTAHGLATCMGNAALYRRMLLKFHDGQKDFAEQFALARADHHPETDTRIAHDLKSNAGNIGAKGVQLAAAKLEVACMEQAPAQQIDDRLQAVLKELSPVIAALEALGS